MLQEEVGFVEKIVYLQGWKIHANHNYDDKFAPLPDVDSPSSKES